MLHRSLSLQLCIEIVQKIVKILHTAVIKFPETRSSILVHTISEMSYTSNVFVCVYPK